MGDVQAIMEELASEVIQADPTDLNALANLHTHLEALNGLLTSEPAANESCGRAKKLVESIVLREALDAEAALNGVRAGVAEIQQILEHALNGASLPPAIPPLDSSVPASGKAAQAESSAVPAGTGREADATLEESAIKADDAGLVRDFITEANSHIEIAEGELLKIEQAPGEKDAIDTVFRAFHTVKGVAGFLGLKQIGTLAHGAESVLDLARKGSIELVGEPIELVLQAVDLLKLLLGSLDKALRSNAVPPKEPKLPALLAKFHAFNGGQRGVIGPAAGAVTKEAKVGNESTPSPTVNVTLIPPAATVASTLSPVAEKPVDAAGTQANVGGGDTTVKVSTDRLDRLINAVGELVIAQAMVQQNIVTAGLSSTQKLTRNVTHLGKITRELQDLSMAMRMVPIQSVFQKMGRIVRDVSKKTGKQIELVIEGGETELDRNLVEAISDPLVHMIRNAADHGLETPEDRAMANKPEVGKILLRACHQSGNVLIQIRDDGRGLNKKKILQKAIQNGIVKPGQELPDSEIFRMIFAAGLSTAEKITDVSGRGVGMDVVKRNVEALRGRIDITSEEGKGTSFVIRLPLTLAVIDGLLVRVGAERYIIPITSVEQTVKPTAEQISTVQNHGEVMNLRGSLLALYRLASIFRVQGESDPTKALVIVVQENERRFGLLVDDLLGQHQVVIKSLGKGVGRVQGVSGAAILGDGNVSLILDVPGLHESGRSGGK